MEKLGVKGAVMFARALLQMGATPNVMAVASMGAPEVSAESVLPLIALLPPPVSG